MSDLKYEIDGKEVDEGEVETFIATTYSTLDENEIEHILCYKNPAHTDLLATYLTNIRRKRFRQMLEKMVCSIYAITDIAFMESFIKLIKTIKFRINKDKYIDIYGESDFYKINKLPPDLLGTFLQDHLDIAKEASREATKQVLFNQYIEYMENHIKNGEEKKRKISKYKNLRDR